MIAVVQTNIKRKDVFKEIEINCFWVLKKYFCLWNTNLKAVRKGKRSSEEYQMRAKLNKRKQMLFETKEMHTANIVFSRSSL